MSQIVAICVVAPKQLCPCDQSVDGRRQLPAPEVQRVPGERGPRPLSTHEALVSLRTASQQDRGPCRGEPPALLFTSAGGELQVAEGRRRTHVPSVASVVVEVCNRHGRGVNLRKFRRAPKALVRLAVLHRKTCWNERGGGNKQVAPSAK